MLRARLAVALPILLLSSGCFATVDVVGGDENMCSAVIDRLNEEIYADPQGCAAIMEFDLAFDLVRWQLRCDAERPDDVLEESQARRFTSCCESDGVARNPEMPRDAFVFYNLDEDGAGVVSVVSNHTNSLIYEAELSDSPRITFPSMGWREPDELAFDCRKPALTDVTSYDADGGIAPQPAGNIETAVLRTGIPEAIEANGGILLSTIFVSNGNTGWVAILQSSSLEYDFSPSG